MNKGFSDEINRLHAEICGALADPRRILLLYTLAQHSMNVSQLSKTVGLPQPTVSRHLKVLRDRSLVAPERHGQSVIYSLRDSRIIKALDLIKVVLTDGLETQIALARTASETLGKRN